MDKYRHTVSSSLDTTVSPPNQIRVSSRKRFLALYVKQACNLLNTSVDSTAVVSNIREAQLKIEAVDTIELTGYQIDKSVAQDGKALSSPVVVGYFKSVSFFGVGRAMPNAITAAEMVKRKMPELHQTCHVSTMEVKDVYEPLEEGLDVMEQTRNAATLTITLTTDGSTMDHSHCGYQKPGEAITFVNEPGKSYKKGKRQGMPRIGEGRRRNGRLPSQRSGGVPAVDNDDSEVKPPPGSQPSRRGPRGAAGQIGGKASGGGRQLNTVSNSTSASGPASPANGLSPASAPGRRKRNGKKSKDDGASSTPGGDARQWMASQKPHNTTAVEPTLLTPTLAAVAAQ
eukprot:GHVS01041101.1.p1 GENE.GHVS01041101.1~~GHVS01041101.1.p1  ORF type:complete len:342 (+),score=59.64 GHVS01041101.1:64-1089(+)